MFDQLASGDLLGITGKVIVVILRLWPFWVTPLLVKFLFDHWVYFIRMKFLDGEIQKSKLLEIKFPQEVTKTPLAMEIVIQALYQTGGDGNWYKKYWEGGSRPWHSLEMVSIGGGIHFYIWGPGKNKSLIESLLYSQYPGIEVFEVPDYTKMIGYEKGKTEMSTVEFDLVKPSPYPIKTYVDFGLDKSGQEEEYKIDPMTTVMEYLAGLRDGEQAWLQIIIRAHKAERIVYKDGKKKAVNWQHEAEEEIEKIKKKLAPKKEGEQEKRATKGEQEGIYAMERSLTKLPFDVGIRAVYIAPVEKYNAGNAGSIQGALQVYGTATSNGFKPDRGVKIPTYPWQETDKLMTAIKNEYLDAYRKRGYFWPPFTMSLGKIKRKVNVLNTEALATMYHVPGGVAATPTISRVLSKKSEAPANLPL